MKIIIRVEQKLAADSKIMIFIAFAIVVYKSVNVKHLLAIKGDLLYLEWVSLGWA